jgi:glycosidase
MTNTKFTSRDQLKDPVSHFVLGMAKDLHLPDRAAFRMMKGAFRDHARTPMQWDTTVNAGFNTGAETWQCVNPDYRTINVEADLAAGGSLSAGIDPADPAFDPGHSIYRFYQKLLALRKSEPTLLYGNTIEYYPDDRQVISYSRVYEGKRFLIVGNFSGVRADFIMPGDFELDELKIRLTNQGRKDSEVEEIIQMKPYEAILFEENR